MTVNTDFEAFLNNIKIKDAETISSRYGSITRRLNMYFRDTEDKQSNSLQAGSYGRHSGINGISDLDMLYVMPGSDWEAYKNNPEGLLDACKREIAKTYPDTESKRDRNVVVVTFTSFVIEVVPVFVQSDGTFKYPDTYNGGRWSICDTRAELNAFQSKNTERRGNLRRLAKMIRSWKARNSIKMSGFLIDTLCYKFFNNTTKYDSSSFGSYDVLLTDFFEFLSKEPRQDYYVAMGSGSHVSVLKSFNKVAEAALRDCEDAIEARGKSQDDKCNKCYKRVFGTQFPNRLVEVAASSSEMFIGKTNDISIQKEIEIDCDVKDDYITKLLSRLRAGNLRVEHHKKLKFFIKRTDITGHYDLKWKVLNQGEIADTNNDHRGQIMDDDGTKSRVETATFYGDHIVECYAIQKGVVIAQDKITVPIA
jgi:hypothetical protein